MYDILKGMHHKLFTAILVLIVVVIIILTIFLWFFAIPENIFSIVFPGILFPVIYYSSPLLVSIYLAYRCKILQGWKRYLLLTSTEIFTILVGGFLIFSIGFGSGFSQMEPEELVIVNKYMVVISLIYLFAAVIIPIYVTRKSYRFR